MNIKASSSISIEIVLKSLNMCVLKFLNILIQISYICLLGVYSMSDSNYVPPHTE